MRRLLFALALVAPVALYGCDDDDGMGEMLKLVPAGT